jgi:hypothetical protein
VDLLKYILEPLQRGFFNRKVIVHRRKDVYPYISGASASPTVIRWLKEVAALKRS